MKEELLSVGIDLGTSTTQLVFSKILIENMASSYTVPRMVITGKTICYKSDIYFTPLLNQTTIDFEQVKELVKAEYEKAGIRKEEIDTGAVIITGETARKENAKEVADALSGFAGDFVVATAGPDLESVISGKGAGCDKYAKEHHLTAVNIDIGGGTSNLAVFCREQTLDTGCLDVGGRLVKVDQEGMIRYIAPKLQKIIEKEGFSLKEGEKTSEEALSPLIEILVQALEQSLGLRDDCMYYDLLLTNHGITHTKELAAVSFSGGVAAVLYHPEAYPDSFRYGDIGILLAKALRSSRIFSKLQVIESAETIRATVVGAGSHTMEISGSTITYTKSPFPMKNLPVLKLSKEEEAGGKLQQALAHKLEWFWLEGEPMQVAVALEGEKNPSFPRIQEYAKELLQGAAPLLEQGFMLVVVVKEDMAKALGQTLHCMVTYENSGIGNSVAEHPIICLDGIHLSEGDYIDIGKPVAEGSVLPVVVKTLIFHE